MRLWLSFVGLLATLPSHPLADPAPLPNPQELGLAEEVNVTLLEVPLTASDRAGHPVTDLSATDLQVKLRGTSLPVTSLSPVTPTLPPELPAVTLVLDDPATGRPIVEVSAPPRRALVLLIDTATDQPARRALVRDAALEFVRTQLTRSDRVAVVSFSGTVALEAGFTADPQRLLAAIDAAFARPPRPALSERRRIDDLLADIDECLTIRDGSSDGCLRERAATYTDEQQPTSSSWLDALSAALQLAAAQQLPTSLLALTHGAPIRVADELAEALLALGVDPLRADTIRLSSSTEQELARRLHEITQLAVRQRIALQFVDPTLPEASSVSARHGRFAAGTHPYEAPRQARHADLRQIAAASGGALRESPDLAAALAAAYAADAGRYRLSIALGELSVTRRDLDRLEVTTRRPGVKLSVGSARGSQAEAPRLAHGSLSVQRRRNLAAERVAAQFRIDVDASELSSTAKRETGPRELAVQVVIRSDAGVALADRFLFLETPATPPSNSSDPPRLTISGAVAAPAGSYRVTLELRELTTGRSALLEQPLTLSP